MTETDFSIKKWAATYGVTAHDVYEREDNRGKRRLINGRKQNHH